MSSGRGPHLSLGLMPVPAMGSSGRQSVKSRCSVKATAGSPSSMARAHA